MTLEAINERRGQFRQLVVNADRFFGAVASRNERLSEIIEILPTFLDETRQTVARLEEFSVDTRPLVQDLQPVATDLAPTLRDVGRLSPDLEQLFRDLGPLIDEAPKNLPRAAAFIRGLPQVFENLHPYLQELNPIIAFLNYYQEQVSDFIMNGSGSISGTLPALPGQGPRHYLRQMSIINSRGLAFQSTAPVVRPRQRLPGAELPAPPERVRHPGGVRLQADRAEAARRAPASRPASSPRVAVGRQPVPALRAASTSSSAARGHRGRRPRGPDEPLQRRLGAAPARRR